MTATSYSPTTNNQWITDSSTTNHMTSDLANITFVSEYQGTDIVTIGNGKGLLITHTRKAPLFLLINLLFI